VGKLPEAEAAFRQALALGEKLVTDAPTVPEYRVQLAGCLNDVAALLLDLGKRPEGEAAFRQSLALREKLVADFPSVPDYAVNLGGGYCNQGKLRSLRGESAASLEWYAKAQATLRAVLDKEPRLVLGRLNLRNTHWGRAEVLDGLHRHAEAAANWEQAVALNDEKQYDSGFRVRWASSLARTGQVSQATAAVEELLRPGNADSDTLYDAARLYAQAAAQAVKEASPSTSFQRAEQYARRAVDLLRQAIQKGYKDVARLKKDTDLDSLRQRPDFQQLLAELEAKAPAK
jgi:tetratricopeptide (TPR) repeat protein